MSRWPSLEVAVEGGIPLGVDASQLVHHPHHRVDGDSIVADEVRIHRTAVQAPQSHHVLDQLLHGRPIMVS